MLAALEPLQRKTHPFAQAPPREEVTEARWVEPRLVGEVEHRKFSRAGRLRHAAWRALRHDVDRSAVQLPDTTERNPADIARSSATEPHGGTPATSPDVDLAQRITVQINDSRVTLSNLDKLLYPATGFTKGEVINYFTHIAPLMLPHLRNRPVTAARWPDGADGQSWFAKNAPAGAPRWLRTVRLTGSGSRGAGGPAEYALVDNLPSLVWLVNTAALELHTPQWIIDRKGQPQLPDRLVFDLDPGGAGASSRSTATHSARVRTRLCMPVFRSCAPGTRPIRTTGADHAHPLRVRLARPDLLHRTATPSAAAPQRPADLSAVVVGILVFIALLVVGVVGLVHG